MALLELNQAAFGYAGRPVVQLEDLKLSAGVCLGIFGPNGAGKTTLLRGITALLEPMRGLITRSDPNLRFGYLPQHRALELHWPMTGLDAASMARSAACPMGWMGKSTREVRDAMTSLGVDDLAHWRFSRLSGGQQQRLLLAGALASKPQVLVLDEPTEGLDVHSRQALLDCLLEQVRGGLCAVMVSHEVEDLLYLADEVAWLHPGDEPQQPSHVEMLHPDQLAQRVVKARRAS